MVLDGIKVSRNKSQRTSDDKNNATIKPKWPLVKLFAICSFVFGTVALCTVVLYFILYFVVYCSQSLIACFYILSLAALIFAVASLIIALIQRTGLRSCKYAFMGFALSGLMLGSCICPIARSIHGRNKFNLNRLYRAIRVYSVENSGLLPNADQWCDLLLKESNIITKDNFRYPLIEGTLTNVAFNSALDKLPLSNIPEDIVLLFEADGAWNLSGGSELLKKREQLETYVLLANGQIYEYSFDTNAITLYDKELDKYVPKPLRWKP